MAYDYFLADSLQRFGFMDLILPFMLIFVLVFAILQKVKIFGEDSKKFNVVIALVMGLMVVVPHSLGMYPRGRDPVEIMLQAIPNISIVLVAILMALIIIGLLGKRFEIGGGSLSGWIAIAAFGLVVYIFGGAAGWWDAIGFLTFGGNPDLMALVITILVFAIIIWFITHEPKEGNDENSIGKQFDKMLKGGS